MKEKILKKILALVLALLLVFNPTAATFILAEEEPTPTPESTITTGDAEAQATTETTANTNEDTVAGEITTPPGNCTLPEGETTCPEDIMIVNDNQAEVVDTANSSATTGDNQIVGTTSDATITTGDATAAGTIDDEINSNTIILEPSAEPTVSPEVTPTPEEEKTLTVENNNEGTVTNNADVTAATGENLASENLGEATILTGDALAMANLLNLLNTNIVGSSFEILFLDLLNNESGDVNLNELWKQILEADGGDSLVLADGTTISSLQILVQNQNQANLENNVNVSAGTGENQANENNNASIETGDATALANVTNIINTNILGSQFFFGVINVLGSFEGNLILPRPEMFAPQLSSQNGGGGVIFENQNQAEVSGQVTATAETGDNEENNNTGDNFMTTGDATARANTFSLVNLNIFRNNWFFLIINNLGNWTGRVFSWSNPEAAEAPVEETQVFELGLDQPIPNGSEELETPLIFQNQNQATVKNNILTSASTGGNQANENRGNTQIKTGNARSLANLFNLVNLNILGGRFFMGLVNILGDWSGNMIFAYPDVAVTLSNGSGEVMVGQTTSYTLSYKNQGNDEAKDAWLRFTLPAGTEFVGDSSGLVPEISGKEYLWFLSNLGAGEGGSFAITVKVDPDFSFEEELSFWSRIIPQVQAAENEKERQIIAMAAIRTGDPESDNSNNSSSVTTIVYLPSESETTSKDAGVVDQRQPKLEITAKNNVNGFVYPGDTVTFEITVKNTGEVPSYNTRLVQKLYNGVPGDIGSAEIELGTIEPGKGGTLTFGTIMADGEPVEAGDYHTISQAIGYAPNDNEVRSNEARTDFDIKLKIMAGLLEARAVGKEEEVLGSATVADCPKNDNVLPYVLLFLLSSYYLVTQAKPRLQRFVNK